jgi:hypothetical protein
MPKRRQRPSTRIPGNRRSSILAQANSHGRVSFSHPGYVDPGKSRMGI